MYLSDDLVTMVKRRGAVPTAQATFTTADILAIADEEIQSYVMPLVRRVREDFYLQSVDFALTASNSQGTTGPYRIPYRAVGGALRDIHLLDANGNAIQAPRLSVDDLEQASWGTYFIGNVVYFVNKTMRGAPTTLRMFYFVRPSRLVLQASAGLITSINTGARTVTLSAAPAAFTGATSFDLIQGRPGFDLLAFDFEGSISGTTVSFDLPLPADLAVGDYVCLPEQTPIPQVPAEMHPLLAQRVVVKYLESQGDLPNLQASLGILTRMEQDSLILVTPRSEGQPKKLTPRGGPWRRWRR